MPGSQNAGGYFVVEPPTAIYRNIECATIGCAFTIVGCVWMLCTYWRFRSRSLLGCAFNDMACVVGVLQLLQAIIKIIVCIRALSTGMVTFTLCDVGGSIEQLLNVSAQTLVAIFFLYLASSNARRRGTTWHTAYGLSAALGTLSLVCCWIVLYDGATGVIPPSLANVTTDGRWSTVPFVVNSFHDVHGMRFTLELGWCWLPSQAEWYQGVSQSGLNGLRFGSSYLFSLLIVVCGIICGASLWLSSHGPIFSSLVGGNYGTNRQSVASWLNGFHPSSIAPVIWERLVLMCVFPIVAYTVGAVSRFSDAPRGDSEGLDAAASFLIPMIGFSNAMAFLWTEGALFSVFSREGMVNAVPDGFAAAVRALSCDAVAGEYTGATYDEEQIARQDSRLISRGPHQESRSGTLFEENE